MTEPVNAEDPAPLPPVPEAAKHWWTRVWRRLRRKTDGRTTPPPASRRFVAGTTLLLALACLGGLIGFKTATDSTNHRIDQRSQARDQQRQADLAKLSDALDTARTALSKANANTLNLKAAACFIAEPPGGPPPNQTPAGATATLKFRQLIGCTADPRDGR